MKHLTTTTTATLLLLGLVAATQAATSTWNAGGGNTNWSTGANWGGSAPANDGSADTVIKGAYASNVDQSWAVKTLTIGNGATLSGQTLTVGTITGTTTGTGNATIQNNLSGGTSDLAFSYGTHSVTGNVFVTAGKQLIADNGASVTIAGTVTADFVTINRGGTLTLSNPGNTISARAPMIYNGTLSANSVSALGGATKFYIAQNGSTAKLQFTGSNGGTLTSAFYLNCGAAGGTATIENTVAGKTLALTGNFTYYTGSAGAWQFTGSGNGLVSGNITTTGASLAKEGTGTWKLTGNNTYGGGTTVSTGILQVSNTAGSGTGTGSVTVASGATLGGTGIIDPGTGNSVTINGILAPGESGVGTLTVGSLGSLNNATLTGTYSADIGDLLNVYGQLALGSSSILNLGGSPTPGTNYTLASYTGGLTGTFATENVPSGWKVTYGSDAITLGLIPEPASLALLAAGGLLMVTRSRRRTDH